MKLGMFNLKNEALFLPQHVAALRISIAFIVLIPFAFYYLRKIPRNKLPAIFGVGFFGNAIPAFLFMASEGPGGISSSLAGMLNATTTIFAVIIGILLFKTKLKPLNYFGILIGFIGASWLALAKGTDKLSTEGIYIFMVLIATFCYGISVNLIRHYCSEIHPVGIAAVSFFFIGIPITCWVLTQNVFTEIMQSNAHLKALGFVAILAIAGTAFAVILFNYLVQITNAVFASTVTYLMPIVSLLWGLAFKEEMTFNYVFAILIILVGVGLTNKRH